MVNLFLAPRLIARILINDTVRTKQSCYYESYVTHPAFPSPSLNTNALMLIRFSFLPVLFLGNQGCCCCSQRVIYLGRCGWRFSSARALERISPPMEPCYELRLLIFICYMYCTPKCLVFFCSVRSSGLAFLV